MTGARRGPGGGLVKPCVDIIRLRERNAVGCRFVYKYTKVK